MYTDNVRLSPGAFEADDFITVFTPGLSIRRLGRALNLDVDYTLQNMIYANDSDRNDQFHLLRVNGNAELLEERFFVDLLLDRSTQNIGNNGDVAFDNLSISSDRASVLSYTISPYWRQRFGNFADLDFRFTYDDLGSRNLNNSDETRIDAVLSSGSNFNRLLWDISVDQRRTGNSGANSTRTSKVSAKLRYLFSRKFAAISTLGYDENRFASSLNDVDGVLWNAGFEWNPSKRTSFLATYGKRFFGDDIELQFNHESRRTRTKINIKKIPRTTRSFLAERGAFDINDPFGEALGGLPQQQLTRLTPSIPLQTTEILLGVDARGDFSIVLPKNTFKVTMTYSDFQYQLSGETEIRRGIDMGWTWNIQPQTLSRFNVRWNKDNQRSDRDDRYFILDYGLSHSLSLNLDLLLSLRRIDRQSTDPNRTYTEHRISAQVSKRF